MVITHIALTFVPERPCRVNGVSGFFVALFAWLLFREMHVNTSVIIGGLLVFAGVAMIIWNNP
jgi:drug/metabolite transporter (DMT)-like permease